ncbi:MAG: proline--tRNA ligase [Erysipelotrichaceae bacterium]|nr:proline--tRNA ligase [Erysipelotrichaceae bacterium]
MKLKNSFFFTIREDVKDEDSASGNLLVKAGFIKKTSAGIYMFLPLGLKVQNNIENIIRKHMNASGAMEVKMPALIASEYYEDSGRLAGFGPSIFKLKDRNAKDFVLGPTHEELFAYAAKSKIRSYKDLPFNLYQFQTKYRDEPRARFGLVRVKEFVMKDAYSFDVDEKGLDIAYQKMFDAYKNSFDEIGINYKIVKADTGIMGGLLSEEFQAISDIGEDTLIYCDDCGFSSNMEITPVVMKKTDKTPSGPEKTLIETPDCESIEDVAAFLKMNIEDTVKCLLMRVDDELVAFFVNGKRELNETKVLKLMGAKEIAFADDELIATSNAVPGYCGPLGLNCKVIVDNEVLGMADFVCGANQKGYHYMNVNVSDISYDLSGDIVNAMDGDVCPICGRPLKFTKGIEVGNTFKLGTKYSKAMDLQFTDEENKLQDVWMGSYGIGLGRTMAAVVEQNHDEKGIIWPVNIAPYKAIILIMSTKDELQNQIAEDLYAKLNSMGIEAMLDDRDERPGVKFNDAELIGIPYRITVGKKASEGIVEFKGRKDENNQELTIEEAIAKMKEICG